MLFNQVKSNIFLICILLTTAITADALSSNAMLSNMKIFISGGVGGKPTKVVKAKANSWLLLMTIHFRLY
jgi:hypothetical protein